MNKKIIQIYPHIQTHTVYKSLIKYPPKGYSFAGLDTTRKYQTFKKLKKNKLVRFLYKNFLKIIKTSIVIDYFQKSRTLEDPDLIFSLGMIYKGKLPWVLDILDIPYCLAGNNYRVFIKNRKKIEKSLLSKKCKKIICAHETSLSIMEKYFSSDVVKKTVLVRPAIEEIKTKVERSDRVIRFLFMGSINNPDDFYMKGGVECIEVFDKLSKRYNNVELIMRCKIPGEFIKKIENNSKIHLIQEEISPEQIINLYSSCHILLSLAHNYVLMSTLEAMSSGLPVISLDTFAVRDYVKNGYNGLVIEKSKKIRGYNDKSYPANVRTKEFISEIKTPDTFLIEEITKNVSLLVENSKLREKIGENGRAFVKSRFSIAYRNKLLKNIFDQALNTK